MVHAFEDAIAKDLLSGAKEIVRLYTPPLEIGIRIENREATAEEYLKNRIAGPSKVWVPNELHCYVANVSTATRRVIINVMGGPSVEHSSGERVLKPGHTAWLPYSEKVIEAMKQTDWETYATRSFSHIAPIYCMIIGEGSPSHYRASAGIYEGLGAIFKPIAIVEAR